MIFGHCSGHRPLAVRRRGLLAAVAAAAIAVPAGGQAKAEGTSAEAASGAPGKKWDVHLDLEAKPGTRRHLGEADLFVPLAQDADTLLFANAIFRFDDDDNREGNVGLGLRRMLEGGWNLGAYGYYDRRHSDSGHHFNQATVGLEALGEDFDLRVNGYLPFGDRVKSLGSQGGGDSFAELSGGTLQVVTPGSTRREERALRGFDAEIGWRVPLWEAEADQALRLYAGGFYFDDSAVDAVAGPRLRAELTMYDVPGLWDGARLTLGGEWQHDDLRGSQGFGLVRLRIPFQAISGRETPRLTAQERRMTDPVERDVDVVTANHTVEAAATTREDAFVVFNDRQIQSVTQIDSATTDGGALVSAIAAAGDDSLVILSGTFNTPLFGANPPPETIELASGQTVMGGGTSLTVRNAAGRTVTFTAPGSGATIASVDSLGVVVEMSTDSILSGLAISNAISFPQPNNIGGVLGASGATINNSTITVTNPSVMSGAFAVETGPVDGFTLRDSVINVANGVPTWGLEAANATNVIVSGNTFNVTGPALNFSVSGNFNTSFVSEASTGNVLINGGCNISPLATGTVSFTNGMTCP